MDINPKNSLPEYVIICGIRHSLSAHEDLIVFSETGGFYGCHSRLCFSKSKNSLWKFSFEASFGEVPVCHIVKAFEIVKQYFGDDHELEAG